MGGGGQCVRECVHKKLTLSYLHLYLHITTPKNSTGSSHRCRRRRRRWWGREEEQQEQHPHPHKQQQRGQQWRGRRRCDVVVDGWMTESIFLFTVCVCGTHTITAATIGGGGKVFFI